jgi:hypothetical protein
MSPLWTSEPHGDNQLPILRGESDRCVATPWQRSTTEYCISATEFGGATPGKYLYRNP